MTPHAISVTEEESLHLRRVEGDLPPTPPETENGDVVEDKLDATDYPLPPPTTLPGVLDIDKKTPDQWVPRDSRLIRLTGVHPFNCEAPLSDLYNEGFLTTPELFYVRNHGAVPECKDEAIPDWEFTVEGLVENPLRLTLRDLLAEYDQITCPVTLVCAGNRRKEQNVVRKTKGFSWGAAGVSTALWTGVVMADLLKKAKPTREARYVSMEGADKLPNGYYGTSVKLNWVMDPNRGMMLAYKMNGEMLRPDHGKPLRVVIPGQIGGRSVKWLKKIIVTDLPSDNWYHIYDNRVLPTCVSPEESANNPAWWMDERYAIYDLSTNSAIAYPAHEERLCVVDAPESYRVKGYAYGGGGRRVTRVEITLDKGKTWRLAKIDYAEDRYREAGPVQLYGGTLDMSWRESSFCWCFWTLDVPVDELREANDIFVRAMDESMNVQPRDMYWSVLGMMNNPWYRITISRENDHLRFEHPTQPALLLGGWMERVKRAGGNLANGFWGEQIGGEAAVEPPKEVATEIKMTKDGLDRKVTIDELREHDGEAEPWFVVNGEVYDGTAFMGQHPGGAQSIVSAAGLDSSDEFMAIHSETAKAMMADYHIGSLDAQAITALTSSTTAQQPDPSLPPAPTFLDARQWKKTVLRSKTTVSWDTRIFTFALDHPSQTLGLPTGQHLMIRLRDPATRDAIIRSYTPISAPTARGCVDVLVKVYFDTRERAGGRMSQAMDALPLGHAVDVKGPVGKFTYLGRGGCAVNGVARRVGRFVMVCAGSGVTPIYQVFRAVMSDSADTTRCVLLSGNRTREDILCKEELDACAARDPGKCRVVYTLTKPPEVGWEGRRGRIGGELLREFVGVGEGRGECMVLICGPEALERSVHAELKAMGWRDEDLLFF
ncbi:hypothetical protein LTR28_010458 [Elasticomyces elasticus]|nr:hypothetical protein LTR28_010458 [Elasticomyces elasticus]